MNVYLVTQSVNNEPGTYSGVVVVAKSDECARKIHPNGSNWDNPKSPREHWDFSRWCHPKYVDVKEIGEYTGMHKIAHIVLTDYENLIKNGKGISWSRKKLN